MLPILASELAEIPGETLAGLGLKTTVNPAAAGANDPAKDTWPCKHELLTETVDADEPPAVKLLGDGVDSVKVKSGLTVTVKEVD